MKKGILVIGSLNMEERGPIRRAQLESWEGECGCWGVLDRMNSDKSW